MGCKGALCTMWPSFLGHKRWNLNTVQAEWEMKQKEADVGMSANVHKLLKCWLINEQTRLKKTLRPLTPGSRWYLYLLVTFTHCTFTQT